MAVFAPQIPKSPMSSSTGLHSNVGEEDIRDRYTFGRQLGKGKFGIVYDAVHRQTGSTVAVKVVPFPRQASGLRCRSEAAAAEEFEATRREAEICLSLGTAPGVDAEWDAEVGQDNVVKVTEVVEGKKHLYIVMELCSGGSLESHIRRKRDMSQQDREDEAAWIVSELAAAVAFCHRRGVLHRDIKPENVLISTPVASSTSTETASPISVKSPRSALLSRVASILRHSPSKNSRVAPASASAPGSPDRYASPMSSRPSSAPASPVRTIAMTAKPTLRLADFGISERLTDAKPRAQAGLVGSPAYLSPEVAAGMPVSYPSDVWGIGVCMYSTLADGATPFSGSADTRRMLLKIRRAAVPVTEGKWAAASDEAKAVVKRLMAGDPKKRPTAEEILSEQWVIDGRARWIKRNGWA